jgi:hypothetical protein
VKKDGLFGQWEKPGIILRRAEGRPVKKKKELGFGGCREGRRCSDQLGTEYAAFLYYAVIQVIF